MSIDEKHDALPEEPMPPPDGWPMNFRPVLSYTYALRSAAESLREQLAAAERELKLLKLAAPPIDRDEKIRALEESVRQHFQRAEAAEAKLAEAEKALEKTILDSQCAYPFSDNHAASVRYCIENKQCGCVYGSRLAKLRDKGGPKIPDQNVTPETHIFFGEDLSPPQRGEGDSK